MADHGHIKDVMKRALTIALALALPLAADETKSANTTTTTTKAAETQAAQPDSPLVAAAKAANRKGKKPKILITHENLKSSGANAHVTTTEKQNPIVMPKPLDPPRPTPEMAAARAKDHQQKLAEKTAAEKKKADDEALQKKAAEAAAREEGYDGMQDDAAEVVGTNPPPPQF